MPDTQRMLNIVGSFVAMQMVLLLGGVIFILGYVDIPEKNQNALLVVIGVISGSVGNIVSFFFGSSSGQKAKDATIASQASVVAAQQNVISPAAVIPLSPGESVTAKADK